MHGDLYFGVTVAFWGGNCVEEGNREVSGARETFYTLTGSIRSMECIHSPKVTELNT